MAHDMTTSSPYEHCVLSGTDIIGSSHGYPDGDMRPSVTLDYKAVYTFRPVDGTIDLVLAPSASSAVVLVAGTTTTNTTFTTPASGVATGFNISTDVAAKGAIRIGTLVPSLDGLGHHPGSNTADEFRPIVLVADFDYTGSSMLDNGALTIQSIGNSEKMVGAQPVNATPGYNADRATFNNPSSSTIVSPSAITQPARDSFTTRIVSVDPKYETTRSSVFSKGATPATDGSAYAWPSTVQTADSLVVAPSYHPACEWTRVTYTGLDASASITVTVRYCVQFAINPNTSSYGPLAQPSPAAKPSITTKVVNFVRLAPIAVKKSVKVWDVFKKIGKTILPFVLPGAGNVISSFL